MSDEHTSRVGVVCARGGSKGLPDKNLVELDGEPLVARTVSQAVETGIFALVVASSDDEQILTAARDAGADLTVRRPAELASDTAGKLGAIRHAVEAAEASHGSPFDVVIDLDVTTPLRRPADIVAVADHLEGSPSLTAVLTATEARRSPYFNLVELNEDGVPTLPCDGGVLRRQDSPPVYELSGAVYAWRRDALESEDLLTTSTRLHLLPRERAWDIDEPLDLVVVRALLADPAAATD